MRRVAHCVGLERFGKEYKNGLNKLEDCVRIGHISTIINRALLPAKRRCLCFANISMVQTSATIVDENVVEIKDAAYQGEEQLKEVVSLPVRSYEQLEWNLDARR